MVSRFSRWPPRWPSWIAKQNDLSNSESLFRSNTSHQVSAQSNLRFGRRCLKISNMAAMAAILAIGIRLKNSNIAAMAAILAIGPERF